MADDLPKEIGRGTMRIGELEIEVINLDNGQRLVTPEGVAAFLQYLEGAGYSGSMVNVTPRDGA